MIGLIMAGGVGTRFWPLSRPERPKQYLNIIGEHSMIRQTADRLRGLVDEVYVVTSADQVHLVKEHLPELEDRHIVVEPFGRNTAPCIALSAAWLAAHGAPADELMLVVPADHVIDKVEEFHRLVRVGETLARQEYLATFGIVPTYPATGYGYIEAGEAISDVMFHVKQFKEKPQRETAEKFFTSGGFFWNSGMFLWKLGVIRKAFNELMPDVETLLSEIEARWSAHGFGVDIADIYERMPRKPIDIGVMEQAKKRAVIPADIDWSDVGGWQALYDLTRKDANRNAMPGDASAIDASGCFVRSDKPVALIGVHDLVIVETDDALLVCSRAESERVKELAARNKTQP